MSQSVFTSSFTFVDWILCKMQLNITGRYLTFIKCSNVCVCVMWWLIHWFHNMTLLTWTHILASNKAESSLFPPRSLSFSSHRFNFPFLLHLSAPSSHLSINSRLRRFIFSSPRLHFLSFISFPLMHIGGMTPHACTNIHMNAKWLKAEMYTVRELIFRVNWAHTRCIFFFDWSYGSPPGPRWKPITLDISHIHLHQGRFTHGC